MRHFVPLTLFLAIVTLFACHRTVRQGLPSPDEAAGLVNEHPDSLAFLLEELIDPAELPDSSQADYWWLLTQAHLRQGRNLVNDSLIHASVAYYEANHSPRLPKAYFLAALQSNWSYRAPEKQQALLLKAEASAKALRDSGTLRDIYIKLGRDYEMRGEYQDMFEANRKLYAISSDWWQVMSLYNMGFAYVFLGKKDSAYAVIERSIRLAEERGYEIVPYLSRNYADFLCTCDQSEKALSILEDLFRRYPESRQGDALFSYAHVLMTRGRIPEARFYMNTLDSMLATHVPQAVVGGQYISIILKLLCDAKEGRPLNIARFGQFNDSVMGVMRNSACLEKEQSLAGDRLVRNNLRLEKEKSDLRLLIVGIAFVALLCVALSVFFYQRKLLRQERLFRQSQDQIRSITAQWKENEAMKKRMDGQMSQLVERERYLSDQLLSRIAIFKQLQASKYLNDEQWPEVVEAVDVLYNDFTKRLRAEYPMLTDGDLLICALLKLRFSTALIASLMGISPSSVTKRKQRIREKMGQPAGGMEKNNPLDAYLVDY